MNIVSLLPSATEIVCQLGLIDQLVGVTHECNYPSDVLTLPQVTRSVISNDASSSEIDAMVREQVQSSHALYTLDVPKLESVRPDLIITQALCDVCAVAEHEVQSVANRLPSQPTVVNLEPMSLNDVLECLVLVGEAAGCEDRARTEVEKLNERIRSVEAKSKQVGSRPRVMILEWIDPPFCAGHWSPELVRLAGGIEIIGKESQRSITVTWSDIVAADPEVMLVACCGFDVERTLRDLPLLERQPGWKSLRCVENHQVYVVDGSAYFSRPGPRLVDSLEVLAHTLHPESHSLPTHLEPALRFTPA